MKQDQSKKEKKTLPEIPMFTVPGELEPELFSALGQPKTMEPTVIAQFEDAIIELLEEVGEESFINISHLNRICIKTTKTNGEHYYAPLAVAIAIVRLVNEDQASDIK